MNVKTKIEIDQQQQQHKQQQRTRHNMKEIFGVYFEHILMDFSCQFKRFFIFKKKGKKKKSQLRFNILIEVMHFKSTVLYEIEIAI